MEIDTVIAIRKLFKKISQYDASIKARRSANLCIRLDNDVAINSADQNIFWDDNDGICYYYTTNSKPGAKFSAKMGISKPQYPVSLSAFDYGEIQEMFVELNEDSFGQSLAVLKENANIKAIGDFDNIIPLDDKLAAKIYDKQIRAMNADHAENKLY